MSSPEFQSAHNNSSSGDDDVVSPLFLKWSSLLFLIYFGARLVFFALTISPSVPPDELTHAGLCALFSRVFILPENSPASYQFGLVTNIPWLYYWTMGKLLHLNVFGLPDLVFLRLLNIPLAFGTVWYALRLLRLLTDSRLARLLLIVALTNTAMFSLLSASVSYDNLTNLLAAMAIYYLFAFFKERSGNLLVASLLCQMAGSLTKITFLPLILALNILLAIYAVKQFRTVPTAVGEYVRTLSGRGWLAAVVFLVAAGLNLQLYAGNYLRYGTLNPSMAVILTPAEAMNYRLEARGMIFNRYREGKISYMDALVLAGEIRHPGDKADTFYLLMNYEKMKANPALWMGPVAYGAFWIQTMVATIIGIKGHLGMYKPFSCLLPVYLVLALAAVGFVVRWRPRESGWLPPALAAVALFYAGYLATEVNYPSYLNYGEPGVTAYGRYLFPIIVPVYVLTCRYLLELFRDGRIRGAMALAVALLFVAYDFPWFIAHATPAWYSWLPQ